MDRFPIPDAGSYSYAQRFTLDHLGIDILAPLDTMLVAVEDGFATASREPKGGNVVYLEGASGTRYFYGHLARWSGNLVMSADPKVRVQAGDPLGFVGTSGNAQGGPPHVHFQMRRGSLVIDPFDDLQAVDPYPDRGTPGETVHTRKTTLPGFPSMFAFPDLGGVCALLALVWLFQSSSRR